MRDSVCLLYLLTSPDRLSNTDRRVQSNKRKHNRPISPYIPFPHPRMPPNTAPLSPSRSLLPQTLQKRLLVQYEHPSVNPPVAHCILRFPTPAPHTKRTSYTAVQQPAVRVGVGVVVASSPLGRTRHTPNLATSASASSCWSALRSSLTRCLAESSVSLCDTHHSSSSVKRGMASAILPCFSSSAPKLYTAPAEQAHTTRRLFAFLQR